MESESCVPLHLPNVEFVNQCPVQFRCRRCSAVDAALSRSRCGHGFCERCVNLVRSVRFQCPVDSRSVEKKELVPDKEIKDKLLQLNVYCLQRKRGCKRTLLFKDLESHLESCGYVPVTCPCGCGLQVIKRELAHHLTSTCERRLVSCVYCQDEVVFRDTEEHHGVCNKRPVTCPHCKAEVRREQLATHENTCPMKPRTCRLVEAGCSFKGTLEELQQHEEDMGSHVVVMAAAVGACRQQITELQQKVSNTDEENRKLKEQLQDIYPVLASIKNFEKNITAMQEKIKKLEIAEQTVEEMNVTLIRLKEHMQRMQPAVVQDHKSKSPQDLKSPESKSPPRGLFSHNSSFEDKHKHAAPPTDL